MANTSTEQDESRPLIRLLQTITFRSVAVVCAAFMLGWFIFLVCGVIWFEFALD